MIPIISIIAYSGTGKTTFMVKLIPELKKRGLRLAVVKHDGHGFEIDKEGKDSYRITQAGADVTALISKEKAAVMENRPRTEEELLSMIKDVDLILTEGYKSGIWPKIMLHRRATGKELPMDPRDCLAVVSDMKIKGAEHLYGMNDVEQVADLIQDYMKRKDEKHNLLAGVPYLKDVSEECLRGLWQDGRVETVPRNTIVIEAKKEVEYVYIQLSGKSSVYNLTHQGEKKVIFIFGSGILLNDHVMKEHSSSLFCETMEESEIFVIPAHRYLDWMKKDFELTRATLRQQEWKMWRMGHQLKNTGNTPVEKKLAAKLWKLSRDFHKETEDGVEIDLNLSITFLSDMLGVPRETTSRACKSLSQKGLIRIDKKRITILDTRAISEFYRKSKKDI